MWLQGFATHRQYKLRPPTVSVLPISFNWQGGKGEKGENAHQRLFVILAVVLCVQAKAVSTAVAGENGALKRREAALR